MVRRATAVIGAGYGDEGKGSWVDRLSTPETTVVRFNGGSQAGHTVQADDGRRHVFHNVGSGSLKGAATHLSRHFLSNPVFLPGELADLGGIGVTPRITADPRGWVVTPYDVLVNQVVELSRGGGRHGSCGHGIGETVERGEQGLALSVADLRDPARVRDVARRIRDEWVPGRLSRLGVTTVPDEYVDLLRGDAMVGAYVDSCAAYLDVVAIDDGTALRKAPQIVFEGAQGLLLDHVRGAFPHVTRSHTGIRNVLDIADEVGLDGLDAVYATRCYLTRHGAGPLAGELPRKPWDAMVDPTNEPNPWQETIRYAHLDVDLLTRSIADDLTDARYTGIQVRPSLAVSCLDQAPDLVTVIDGGEGRQVARTVLSPWLRGVTGLDAVMSAWGPQTSDSSVSWGKAA